MLAGQADRNSQNRITLAIQLVVLGSKQESGTNGWFRLWFDLTVLVAMFTEYQCTYDGNLNDYRNVTENTSHPDQKHRLSRPREADQFCATVNNADYG